VNAGHSVQVTKCLLQNFLDLSEYILICASSDFTPHSLGMLNHTATALRWRLSFVVSFAVLKIMLQSQRLYTNMLNKRNNQSYCYVTTTARGEIY